MKPKFVFMNKYFVVEAHALTDMSMRDKAN